jgi:hypothetical protein
MSSLCIVVGFDGVGATAKPHLVYLGRDAAAGAKARECSNAVRFEVFSQAVGLRKMNDRHDASKPATAVLPQVETLKALKALDAGEAAWKLAAEAFKRVEGEMVQVKERQASLGADASPEAVQAAAEAVEAVEAALALEVKSLEEASREYKRLESVARELVKADKARGVKFGK